MYGSFLNIYNIIYIYIYIYIYMYTYMYTHMYVRIDVHVCIHTFLKTSVHTEDFQKCDFTTRTTERFYNSSVRTEVYKSTPL